MGLLTCLFKPPFVHTSFLRRPLTRRYGMAVSKPCGWPSHVIPAYLPLCNVLASGFETVRFPQVISRNAKWRIWGMTRMQWSRTHPQAFPLEGGLTMTMRPKWLSLFSRHCRVLLLIEVAHVTARPRAAYRVMKGLA